MTRSLDDLIREELALLDISRRASAAMVKCPVGSEEGRRFSEIAQAADRRFAEARKAVRDHPDHSYEGL